MSARQGRARLAAVAVAGGLLAAMAFSPAPLAAAANLLANADLSRGGGNSPDQWRVEGWEESPETTTYAWTHAPGGPGELEVANRKPNDARYQQTLTLGAGWYYFSGEIRTVNVGTNATGASISILEDGIMSADLHGDQNWQKVGFYLYVGARGADVEFACRLGGYSSLNTGQAFFRRLSAERVAGLPVGAEKVFDLEAIRKQAAGVPIGSPWTLAAAFILLALVAALGWIAFGEAAPAPRASAGQEKTRPRDTKRSSRPGS